MQIHMLMKYRLIRGMLSDSSFFADLTIDEAELALQYANETDYQSMVDNGNLTIEDSLEQLFGHSELLEFASSYSITTWDGNAYPGAVSDIGALTVEQAGVYYGAANFVSPENAISGPNYTINDTAQAIADGVNSADTNVANGIFAATSVVADGGAPVDIDDAALVQGASDYDAANSDYAIEDSASAILGDTGSVVDAAVSGVVVTDATGAGYVDAADGADLSALELEMRAANGDTNSDIEFRVEDSASAIAAELSADNTLLDGANDLVVDGGITDIDGAFDIQSSAAYDAANSDYAIEDSASAILGDTGSVVDAAVSGVVVTDATGAGYVDAADGADLSALELEMRAANGDATSDIEFRVEDSASAIAAELSADNTLLDGANDLVVDGGITDIDGAFDIQSSAAYDAANSDYAIEDSVSAILGDTGSVVDAAVSGVVVTDATGAGYVDAADGADLSALELEMRAANGDATSDIEFRVEDSASAIAAELSADNTLLDGANDLVVDGGITDIDGAFDIQSSAAYDAANSDYAIEDSVSAILGDTGSVVDAAVSGVVVTDATGAGYVDAADGADLSALELEMRAANGDATSDIEFRVEDSASAIAAELSADNTLLDGANDLVVDGGITDIDGAFDIQSSAAYDAANSDYAIEDSASAILGDTGSVVDSAVSGVVVTDATGAGYVDAADGADLSALELEMRAANGDATSDIEFRVEDSASAIAAELSADNTLLDGANDLVVDGGITDIDGAFDIQSSAAYDAANSDYAIEDSASAILGDTGSVVDAAVSGVVVTDATGAGYVDAADGADLSALELEMRAANGDATSDIEFRVEDSASAIAAELSADNTLLDGANDLVVDGGITDIDGAFDIQSSAAYDSVASSYTISDTAGAILDHQETSIDKGVTTIDVDGPVGAGVGVQLGGFEDSIYGVTGYSSDVQFEVQDDANAIAQALVANGNGALNNAEDVNVDGGVVSVDSADIQGVAEYNASVSDYAIEDSSAAILQGAATVIDSGVEQVFVTDTVSVADGVSLSDMEVALEAERGLDTADIDFDVVGSASEIIANLPN